MRSIVIPADVFSQSWFNDAAALSVYMHILASTAAQSDVNNDEYICSYRTLAAESDISLSRIRKILDKLEESGYIKRSLTDENRAKTVIKTLNIGRYLGRCNCGETKTATDDVAEKQKCPLHETHVVQGRCSSPSENFDCRENKTFVEQPSPLNPLSLGYLSLEEQPLSPSPPIVPPSLSPQTKNKTQKQKSPREPKPKYFLTEAECYEIVCEYTPSEAVRAAALGWIKMRYAKRGDHRCTERAMRSCMDKARSLARTEREAVMVFQQSEERNWDGLFEVKG